MTTIAIDFGGTRIKIGIVLKGAIQAIKIIPAESHDLLVDRLNVVGKEIQALLAKNGLSTSDCLGIGVSYPSIVDPESAQIKDNFGKFGESDLVDLRAWAKSSLGLPLAIENDARVTLLGEWKYGVARNLSDVVVVTFGTGIGVAAVQENRLVVGPHQQAAILGGHITINTTSPRPCICGNRGCAEEECRVSSLMEHPAYKTSAWSKAPSQDFASLFSSAVDKKDESSMLILQHVLSLWGALLVNVTHTFDPSMIVLCGGLMKSSAHILPSVTAYLHTHSHTPWGKVNVVSTELHEAAVLLGCEWLLKDYLESQPKPTVGLPTFQHYDKYPVVRVTGFDSAAVVGADAIANRLHQALLASSQNRLIVELYPGVRDDQVRPLFLSALRRLNSEVIEISTLELFKPHAAIDSLVEPFLGSDPVFGKMNDLSMLDFLDAAKVAAVQARLSALPASQALLLIGPGAALLSLPALLVHCDLPRWEAQLRFRRREVTNLGAECSADIKPMYKRAYFVDWRVADRLKFAHFEKFDFFLDSTHEAKLVTGPALRAGLAQCARRPLRVVPFFDPAPWGGQWMRRACDLDQGPANFGWCFDCVPEENSLMLRFGPVDIEIPSLNLVDQQAKLLLGDDIVSRFGREFPIRFDFLDTIEGGNLSLQVHPLTAFMKENFGLDYTQDESYYILDCYDDATVYLGIKEVSAALREGQQVNSFHAEQYVNVWPAKKHDHFLIPSGTVHCSGKNSMVLEISATPYIFTFKLLGLDGKPRPIHLDYGIQNIQWERRTKWTKENLVNCITPIDQGPGWREERTGLHELEFIEVRRHWFRVPVLHHTLGTVNVLNLVEGRAAVVSSPEGSFEAYLVHYAETFIVPACVGQYVITPVGTELCATVKAYVRPAK